MRICVISKSISEQTKMLKQAEHLGLKDVNLDACSIDVFTGSKKNLQELVNYLEGFSKSTVFQLD